MPLATLIAEQTVGDQGIDAFSQDRFDGASRFRLRVIAAREPNEDRTCQVLGLASGVVFGGDPRGQRDGAVGGRFDHEVGEPIHRRCIGLAKLEP
jgi:hypothetical protein